MKDNKITKLLFIVLWIVEIIVWILFMGSLYFSRYRFIKTSFWVSIGVALVLLLILKKMDHKGDVLNGNFLKESDLKLFRLYYITIYGGLILIIVGSLLSNLHNINCSLYCQYAIHGKVENAKNNYFPLVCCLHFDCLLMRSCHRISKTQH